MRRIPAIFLAVLVALGLFWMMHALVNLTADEIDKPPAGPGLDFIRLKQQEVPQERSRVKPKKPPPPKTPPPPPKMQSAATPKPQQPVQNLNIPNLNLPTNISGGPFLGTFNPANATGDSEAIPLVRINAQYPRSALRSGTQGEVVIEFIINPDGTVREAKIISAKPRGVFERAAISAALKWKFKPKIVDGKPVPQTGRQPFTFSLDN